MNKCPAWVSDACRTGVGNLKHIRSSVATCRSHCCDRSQAPISWRPSPECWHVTAIGGNAQRQTLKPRHVKFQRTGITIVITNVLADDMII